MPRRTEWPSKAYCLEMRQEAIQIDFDGKSYTVTREALALLFMDMADIAYDCNETLNTFIKRYYRGNDIKLIPNVVNQCRLWKNANHRFSYQSEYAQILFTAFANYTYQEDTPQKITVNHQFFVKLSEHQLGDRGFISGKATPFSIKEPVRRASRLQTRPQTEQHIQLNFDGQNAKVNITYAPNGKCEVVITYTPL